MLTAFSMSSMQRKLLTELRRVRTPKSRIANSPIENTRAKTTRNDETPGISVLAREVERAQEGADEEHAEQLEGHRVRAEEGARERDGRIAGHRLRRGRRTRLDQEAD